VCQVITEVGGFQTYFASVFPADVTKRAEYRIKVVLITFRCTAVLYTVDDLEHRLSQADYGIVAVALIIAMFAACIHNKLSGRRNCSDDRIYGDAGH